MHKTENKKTVNHHNCCKHL